MKAKKLMTLFHAYIEVETAEALKAAAEDDGRSTANLVRNILKEWLAKQGGKK